MKIRLVRSGVRNIGQRNVLQQPLRGRIDRQPGILQNIARNRLPVVRIDQLNSRHGGKIAAALGSRWHERESVKGGIAARSVVIRKEECLAASLVDSRDIQRAAQ